MVILNAIIVTLVILFYRPLQAISFDETFATVVSVPVDRLYLMLIGMVALTVVMTMRIVGLIMVIALLTIPPAIAGLFVRDMKHMMLISVILSIVFTIIGLALSYTLNLTSGATIILVTGLGYFLSYAYKSLRKHEALRKS